MNRMLHAAITIKHKIDQFVASGVQLTSLNLGMCSKHEHNQKLGITNNLTHKTNIKNKKKTVYNKLTYVVVPLPCIKYSCGGQLASKNKDLHH